MKEATKLARVTEKGGAFGVEIPGYHFGREWDKEIAEWECKAFNEAIAPILQSEREKVFECAKRIALLERVNVHETDDEGDRAYNRACEDIANAIEARAKEESLDNA